MGALGLAASGMPAGCLTAYPPPLPDVQHRPTILPDEVPAVDVPLVDWPPDGTFIAQLDVDPGSSFTWAAFLDYDPSDPTEPISYGPPTLAVGDGPSSIAFSVFSAGTMPSAGLCHRIDLVVANALGQSGPLTPSYFRSPSPDAGLGGDVVTWWYTGGLSFGACSPYGGPLPDAGFQFPDAPSDSPSPVPE
jgi:hypothetical protein